MEQLLKSTTDMFIYIYSIVCYDIIQCTSSDLKKIITTVKFE